MADHPNDPKFHGERIVQSAQTKRDSIDDLYNKVMGGGAGRGGKPAPSIENKGAIGLMVLPKNWVPGPADSGVRGASYYVSYHPPDKHEVHISVAYNGKRQDKSTAEQFVQAVDKRSSSKLHELTKDEQAGIASILGVRNDPAQFHLDSASVEIIDGKRVLLTNGLYKGNSVRETTAYVDADGKGSTIQEISLQAPDAAFSGYELQYKEMLRKLIWKP